MHTDLVSAPYTGNRTVFLSGPAGAGKTTLAVRRLLHLLAEGVPADQILILVPQRTLALPYYEVLRSPQAPAGGLVDVATIGGLARRTLGLFWPLVSEAAGFARPDHPPRFLTLETTQYHMDRIVERFVAEAAFDGVTITRPRLVSQIIDNLNKAAAVGFGLDEIGARLKGAWGGESSYLRVFDRVQAVALEFRRTCLAENLLDWSLQIEVFQRHLLPRPELRRYLLSGYRHLIVDNVEEDIPASHSLLRTWVPLCESALVILDTQGGYRVFLGADPQGALELAELCRQQIVWSGSHVTSPSVAALGRALAGAFLTDLPPAEGQADPRAALRYHLARFHPEMLDWVADEVSRLVREEDVAPTEIAILAPFISDALRFSLGERLQDYHIPVRSHRPSRQLREEPAARCLLTLAKLAHPEWRRPPPSADVAQALMQAIADLDPIRARLLTDVVYRVQDGRPGLLPSHDIVTPMQERLSYLLGTRYDQLRAWLKEYTPGPGEELDHFFGRLFGELLSQSGFGFHQDPNAGAVAANLIESVNKFRQGLPQWSVAGEGPAPEPSPDRQARLDASLEYIDMVERGVVAAQYISSWQMRPENAVLLVPAYTFLMMNQPVRVQFWLDAGSRAWYERIYQPLTHPYVLRRDWPSDRVWADEDEVRVRDESLGRLILGLSRRCRERIYLAHSELNEQGYEQQGPLLQAVQRMLRHLERAPGGAR